MFRNFKKDPKVNIVCLTSDNTNSKATSYVYANTLDKYIPMESFIGTNTVEILWNIFDHVLKVNSNNTIDYILVGNSSLDKVSGFIDKLDHEGLYWTDVGTTPEVIKNRFPLSEIGNFCIMIRFNSDVFIEVLEHNT